MHPIFLGDSYDIVKRFFSGVLRSLGYAVYVDPMLSGSWGKSEKTFYRFLGVEHVRVSCETGEKRALFVDPDTGVSGRATDKHVSFAQLAQHCHDFQLVFAFDQSFSRARNPKEQMQSKLTQLSALGCSGCYYDSHARFIFISRELQMLTELRKALVDMGLPKTRLFPQAST